jgi:hypothetical protein
MRLTTEEIDEIWESLSIGEDEIDMHEYAEAIEAAVLAKIASGQEPDMLAISAALGFDPTNHHNAAKCPYCRPATPAQQPLSKTQIKAIFLANGFTIKDGLDDLKPYVYDAARAIEANHGIKEKP